METLIINVPEKKSTLVKLLLRELSIKIQNKVKARQSKKLTAILSRGQNQALPRSYPK